MENCKRNVSRVIDCPLRVFLERCQVAVFIYSPLKTSKGLLGISNAFVHANIRKFGIFLSS